MYFRIKHFDKYAGVFLLISVIVIVAALVFVGRGQRWFEERHEFITVFEDAGGIETGATVVLAGIEIGTVKEMRLNNSNKVEILLSILDPYRDRIRVDSMARISGPIIGSKVIEVSVGSMSKPSLDAGGVIQSKETKELTDVITEIDLKSPIEKITETLDNIKSITDKFNRESDAMAINLREATEKLNDSLSVITGDVGGITHQLKGSFKKITRNIEETTEEIVKASKSLGRTFDNMESMTNKIEAGEGNLGAIIKERKLYDNLLETTGLINKTLTNLERASSDISGMMEKISEAIDDLKRSTSSIPHIINTGQETVEDAQEVLQSLKQVWPISRNIREPQPVDTLHGESREGPYTP
ncbi:MAG: MlaD family protein [Thermodesulfobacteriota bacterium]|nr:MlaD family protein [Thermodesulfobacteriota bacterium]